MKQEPYFLLKRAEEFFLLAKEMIVKKRYNISALASEQAVQLWLKYLIYLKAGDYPKVHELEKIFESAASAYNEEGFMRIYNDNVLPISSLEAAYATSRYLPHEFNEQEAGGLYDLALMIRKESARLADLNEQT